MCLLCACLCCMTSHIRYLPIPPAAACSWPPCFLQMQLRWDRTLGGITRQGVGVVPSGRVLGLHATRRCGLRPDPFNHSPSHG